MLFGIVLTAVLILLLVAFRCAYRPAPRAPRIMARISRNDSDSEYSTRARGARVAILITGEMRFANLKHIQKLRKVLKLFDVYISTDDPKAALLITTPDRIITPEDLIGTPNRKKQWLHLHELLHTFDFSDYSVICKLRTDFQFQRALAPKDFYHVRKGFVYTRSDQAFYADTPTFLKVFSEFYDEIPKYQVNRYFSLPYENMRKSERGALSDTYSTRDIPKDIGLVAGRFVFPTFVRENKSTPWKTVLDRIARGQTTNNGPYYACKTAGCGPSKGFKSEFVMALHVLLQAPAGRFALPMPKLEKDRRRWTFNVHSVDSDSVDSYLNLDSE